MIEPLTKEERETIQEVAEEHLYQEFFNCYEATVQDLERQLSEQQVLIVALGEALGKVEYIGTGQGAWCPWCIQSVAMPGHKADCPRQQALAPDAVRQAIETAKAKDAELAAALANMENFRMAGIADRVRVEDTEARLAVATSLLISAVNGFEALHPLANPHKQEILNRHSAEIYAFLSDPSQAVADYSAAMKVRERVRDLCSNKYIYILNQIIVGGPKGEQGWSEWDLLLALQKALLGEAEKETQP